MQRESMTSLLARWLLVVYSIHIEHSAQTENTVT